MQEEIATSALWGLLAMTVLFDGAVRNVRKRQEPWFLPLCNQYFFFSTKYAPQ